MPESNEEIKATLQAVLDDVERNSRIYGYFSSNVTNIAVATIGLTTQVDKLDGRVGRLEESAVETNTRLDKIDGRLDKMDGRLDKIDTRSAWSRTMCGRPERTSSSSSAGSSATS